MTIPCANCGAPRTPGAACPACGAPQTPEGPTVFVEPAPPPWSIPIREPAPTLPAPLPHRSSARTIGVAAAVACTLLVGTAFVLVDRSGPDEVVAADVATTTTTDGGTDVRSSEVIAPATSSTTAPVPIDPPTTDAPVPAAAPTTAATSTAPTAAPPTTSPSTTGPPTSEPAGEVPILSSSFRGWVAQLSSVSHARGEQGLEDAWRTVSRQVSSVVATSGDDWGELTDGYWVLVVPGPFADPAEVESFCDSLGRSRDDCLPRRLLDRR